MPYSLRAYKRTDVVEREQQTTNYDEVSNDRQK